MKHEKVAFCETDADTASERHRRRHGAAKTLPQTELHTDRRISRSPWRRTNQPLLHQFLALIAAALLVTVLRPATSWATETHSAHSANAGATRVESVEFCGDTAGPFNASGCRWQTGTRRRPWPRQR